MQIGYWQLLNTDYSHLNKIRTQLECIIPEITLLAILYLCVFKIKQKATFITTYLKTQR